MTTKSKQRQVAAAPIGRGEGSELPVQGLLPLGVLNPQGAQNRIHQWLVLEDDPPEAVQERHRGDPGLGRAAAPSAEAGTARGRDQGLRAWPAAGLCWSSPRACRVRRRTRSSAPEMTLALTSGPRRPRKESGGGSAPCRHGGPPASGSASRACPAGGAGEWRARTRRQTRSQPEARPPRPSSSRPARPCSAPAIPPAAAGRRPSSPVARPRPCGGGDCNPGAPTPRTTLLEFRHLPLGHVFEPHGPGPPRWGPNDFMILESPL